MTTANVQIKKILVGRGNTTVSSTYTGVRGEITMDTTLKTLRVHDGVVVGGTRLATYAELANVAVGNINLSGYATTAQITAANANAAVQAVAINSINANIGAFQTYANATFTGGGAGTYSNANVVAYLTTVAGNIIPSANVVYSLGSATRQWKDLWVSNNTIYINSIPLSITADGSLLVNGAPVSGGSTYGNANVAEYLPTYTGNIAGNIVKSGYTWTFSNTGTTTFPTGVRLSNARGANTVNFTTDVDKSFQIETQTSTTGRLWSFGTDGNLTLPQNANINFSNGVSILSTVAGTYSNANVASYLVANPQSGTYSNTNVAAYMAPFYTYANATYSTVANAATQATQINTINANVAAANGAIITANTGMKSYVDAVTTAWTANAAAAHAEIDDLRANITAANAAIATLQTGSGFATIQQLTANVSAANSAIVTANTGMKSYVDAVTTAWTANAGTQATDINALRANITAANSAITTLQTQVYSNVNTAAYLAGNVTTGNLTVSYNAVVLGNLQVNGTQTTVNTATLNVADLYITVANGAINSAAANGAGLRVAGALANISYSSVSDSFEFNKPITVGNVIFANNTRFFNNNITLPNGQGFNWHFYDPMIGGATTTLYYNGLTTTLGSWVLETGNGTNAWILDSDTQEFYLFNGAGDGKLVFGNASNAGTGSINDIELKSTSGNVYITANTEPWTFREDGNLILPTNMNFMSSPAMSTTGIVFGDGSFQNTAYTQAPVSQLINGVYTATLDGAGNLTVPGSILPNSDNVFDLGSSLYRFRHLYVGPGTVYIGNAAIKSTVSGNLILPGVTRAVASTAFVEQVEDTDDQSYSFATNPTIIDNAHFAFLNGNADNLSFTPATYSSSGIDNEGYIRNITIDTAGSGYSDQVADLAEQDMWATEAADPINNFVAGDWTQIPFRAETRAGESEYEFDAGGGTDTGDITFDGYNISSTANVVNITASDFAQLESNNNYVWVDQEGVHIELDSGGEFVFEHTGGATRLKLPAGADIVNDAGESVLGGGGNVGLGNFTFSDDTITNSNGLILNTSRGTLAVGTNMEVPGVAGHFHIAFDGSNSNPPASDLFLGDDHNYVKLPGYELDPSAQFGVEIGTNNRSLGPQNIEVDTVDELVPPGGVWRLFIIIEDYPNLGSDVSIGDTVTTSWGTPITATVTGVVEAVGDGDWQIQVDQDITAGFSVGDTVSFGTPSDSYTWRFGTDGTLTLPNAMTIDSYGTSGTNATVTIGGDNTEIRIDNDGAPPGFRITTDKTGESYQWLFGPDGVLTFPSGMTMGYTGGDVIEATANSTIGIVAQGSAGVVGVQWVNDYSNPTSVAGMYLNSPFAANGAVQLITGSLDPSDPTSIEHTWTFGANGTVVVPGAIVAGVSNSKAYRGFYATVNQISEQGGGADDDPSLNQIILSRSATMRGYNLSDDTNEDTFFANGITGSSHVAVINLYGADTSDPIPLEHIKTFVRTYIDLVLYDGDTLRTDVADIQTAFDTAQADLVDSLPADTLHTPFDFNEIQAVINTAGMTTSGTGSGFLYYYSNDTRNYSSSDETNILVPGTGYQVSDTITVPGTVLGGIAPNDNMTITVTGVDGSGGITSVTRSGSMNSVRFANLFVKHFVYDGDNDAYDQGNFIGTDLSECVFTATANAATERITVSAVTSGELAPFQVFWSQNEDNYNYMILHQVSGTTGGAGVYALGGYDDIDDEATATTYTANGIYYGINDPQYNSPAFGGGDYVSMVNTEVGIFTMVAVNADIDRVSYLGETGADGDGVKILTTDFEIGDSTVERLPIELVVGTNTWAFENTGNLTLPQTSNVGITFSDGTFQKTAYTRLDNLMLDGGAAAAIYEVTVDYAEGGFSSTRYGVNTPSFNGGGAEITEPTYYTLNGGGA